MSSAERDERIRAQPRGFAAQLAIEAEHCACERRAAETDHDFLPAKCVDEVHVCGILIQTPARSSRLASTFVASKYSAAISNAVRLCAL